MKYKPLEIGELIATIPIVQGGMGIGVSLGRLAGHVAKEGGVGIISAAQIGFREKEFESHPFETNLKMIGEEYKKARDISPKGVIGFNIMVAMKYYEAYVREAVKVGADLIISGAGLPTELPEYVKGSNTKIAPIVSTEKSIKVILKYWDKKYKRTADMVVIEGPIAGGHLGFTPKQLEEFTTDVYKDEVQRIQEIVKEYKQKYQVDIPVVLAGGIYHNQDMEQAMSLGVQGVQVGTRFVTTEECDASEFYKNTYVQAEKEDIKIVISPVGMPGRAIVNSFMERVNGGEKMTPAKCLQCLHKCNPKEIPYCITEALINAVTGNVEQGLLFCGADAYKATKIETVKEVIESFVKP